MYGAGLAELRLGELLLSQQPRDSYVLCTKVGRLVLDEIDSGTGPGEKGGLFEHGRPNKIVYDYSADGTQRSVEDSLKRLGVDRLDIVLVHDPAQDFHGDAWLQRFETARTGAFGALSRLREEGVIKAWGLGTSGGRFPACRRPTRILPPDPVQPRSGLKRTCPTAPELAAGCTGALNGFSSQWRNANRRFMTSFSLRSFGKPSPRFTL